jgi:hypothetical protein
MSSQLLRYRHRTLYCSILTGIALFPPVRVKTRSLCSVLLQLIAFSVDTLTARLHSNATAASWGPAVVRGSALTQEGAGSVDSLLKRASAQLYQPVCCSVVWNIRSRYCSIVACYEWFYSAQSCRVWGLSSVQMHVVTVLGVFFIVPGLRSLFVGLNMSESDVQTDMRIARVCRWYFYEHLTGKLHVIAQTLSGIWYRSYFTCSN